MGSDTILLVLGLPAAYGALVLGLAVLLQPLRREMVRIAEAMLADNKVNAESRRRINQLLDTCISFRVGLTLPFAIIGVIIDDMTHRVPPPPKIAQDPRYHAIVKRYFLSILGVNPLAAMISIPLIAISLVAHKLKGADSFREAVEEPVVRASGAIVPASC